MLYAACSTEATSRKIGLSLQSNFGIRICFHRWSVLQNLAFHRKYIVPICSDFARLWSFTVFSLVEVTAGSNSMTGTYLLLALTILAQAQALGSDFSPKTSRQQFSNVAVNNIKIFTLLPAIVSAVGVTALPSLATAADKKSFEYQPALAGLDYGKPRTYYPDFVQKTSGLQYKVVKEGTTSVIVIENPP